MRCLNIVLYAILLTASTIVTKAQELTPVCHMDEARSSALKAVMRGAFSNLVFVQEPYYAGNLSFHNGLDEKLALAQFEGQVLAVNMWAMWCVPCRAEMADLSLLSQKSGDENFAVLAINMDKNSIDNSQIHEFLSEVGATNLTLYRDETMDIFKTVRQAIPARGLPFTLIVDRQGCAIASLTGAAPWGDADGIHFIETLKEQTATLSPSLKD